MGEHMDKISGRTKETAGAAMNDDSLRDDGKADQRAGKVKGAADSATDKIGDAADRLGDKMKQHT